MKVDSLQKVISKKCRCSKVRNVDVVNSMRKNKRKEDRFYFWSFINFEAHVID